MRHNHFFIICCVMCALFLASSSHACTTFCLDSADGPVVGKNFDWPIGDALVVVNKRNVAKKAYIWTGEQTAGWTSKYGSVTFNPYGREHPFSGINEVGLVVSAMGLMSDTIYQPSDSRPAIRALQWIQYQLDNAATVEQVLTSNLDLRISNSDPMALHFLVCDSTGTCATIEFLDGELVYHTQETMPVKVLANSIYSRDLEYWETKEIPAQVWSTGRFCTAAEMLEDYNPATSEPAVDYTFTILSNLKWSAPTQWSIAYDIPNQRINFHTLENGDIRYFDINSFDFSCLTPVKILDVQKDLSGDISGDFINYTYEINRDLIEKAYAPWDVSNEFLDAISEYPETTECVGACEVNDDCDRGTCVGNVCIIEGAMQIDKCSVKAGKKDKGDSLKFSGMLDASAADFNAAMGGYVVVTIKADNIPDMNATTYMFSVDDASFNKGKYKSPKIKPADKSTPITSLQIDAIKGKMKFSGKNLDLTGLSCPITITIQIADPVTETVLDEAIVNGSKKPCPPELMEDI